MSEFVRYALNYPAVIVVPLCGFLAALLVIRVKARYIKGGSRRPQLASEERPSEKSSQHSQHSVNLHDASSQLVGLAEHVAKGAEILLIKDGAPYVAIVDAKNLNYYHALDADHRQQILLSDAENGLKDAVAGKTIQEDKLRKDSGKDPK